MLVSSEGIIVLEKPLFYNTFSWDSHFFLSQNNEENLDNKNKCDV